MTRQTLDNVTASTASGGVCNQFQANTTGFAAYTLIPGLDRMLHSTILRGTSIPLVDRSDSLSQESGHTVSAHSSDCKTNDYWPVCASLWACIASSA